MIAGISFTAFVFSSKREPIVVEAPPFIELDRIYDEPYKKLEAEIKKPESQAAQPAARDIKTFDNREITPTTDADDSRITVKKPNDAFAVTADNPAGAEIPQNLPITKRVQGNGNLSFKDTVINKSSGNEGLGFGELSVAANFLGGIDAFRNKVIDKFDTAYFEDEGMLSTIITFVI